MSPRLPSIHVLDPRQRLREAEAALGTAELEHCGSLEELADVLRLSSEPLAAIADVADLPEEAASCVTEVMEGRPHLLLAVVHDRKAGCRWLAAGATDFAVFGEDPAELESRAMALLHIQQKFFVTAGAHVPETLRRISHDMKNPLNCIFGYLDLLLQEPSVPEQARQDLLQISRNTEQLLELVNDLSREPRADETPAEEASHDLSAER